MNRADNPRCAHLIAVADQIVRQLADADLRAAFLFGSAAWGDADEASDLDIMLLLDRPAGYREVTRVRVADLLGRPLPEGPVFADLDRISSATFAEVTAGGGWGQRVVNSVVLRDTDGEYARLRERVGAAFAAPAAREARFQQRREQAEACRAAARQALHDDSGDAALAALHARLAVGEAATALVELNGDRLTLTHFVESVERALGRLGQGRLFAPFLRALALDAPSAGAERSLRAYRAFADALGRWVADPGVGGRLSGEDLAWAAFTYGDQTAEEIAHKVAVFRRLGRFPALLYYLDGLLQVPIRISVGKILLLRSSGVASRPTIPEFQLALRAEPALLAEWVAALRLATPPGEVRDADELAGWLLQASEAALRSGAPAALPPQLG